MKKLCYEVLDELDYEGYLLKEAPERILQFGEGNFLRGFVDYFIDVMNEKADFNSKVVIVQPTGRSGFVRDALNEQEGLYTLLLRGNENGQKVNEKRVISCVSKCINPYSQYDTMMEYAKSPDLRFIVCNTTEAGIKYQAGCKLSDRPASSYPAKLTQFLFERFRYFGEEKGKGFIILPCELIDYNGKELKKIVLQYTYEWELGEAFEKWIEEENVFCSTLVDRIVTGYPKSEAAGICQELGYEDSILDAGEIFAFWAIEGPEWLKEELPFENAGLPVVITPDHKPYKQRKVRILNGAHTSMVLGAYLAGKNIVRDCIEDEVVRKFMEQTIHSEIIPTLSLPKEELVSFANSVTERFSNPYIEHELLAIALNSTSKWKARVLPSFKEYVNKFHAIPECIAASLSFYIAFYRGNCMEGDEFYGTRGMEKYRICDDMEVKNFYYENRNESIEVLAERVLSNVSFWGEDLTKIEGLQETVIGNLRMIEADGCYTLMKKCVK